MIISDLNQIAGRTFPARRLTQNLVNGVAPIQARTFPWATSPWSPTAGRFRGTTRSRKRCISSSKAPAKCVWARSVPRSSPGQAVYIPSGVFHQLTNIGDTPLRMIYCYGPAGDVAHWRQELDGTLPKAGIDAPPLPPGAQPQCTDKPA